MSHPAQQPTRGPVGLLGLLAALVLLVSACGGGDEDTAGDETGTTGSSAAAEDTAVDDEDEAAGDDGAAAEDSAAEDTAVDDGSADDGAAGGDAAPAAEGQPVELGEWFVEVGDVTAGTTTFAVSNSGENTHALAVARGTAYEQLPLLDNGAVDTDALGDDYLGASDEIDTGQSTTVELDLEAGDYVFFCPIAVGPNSHAGRGQVLSLTVS